MIKSKHHGVINNNEKINNAFKVNGFKVINYIYANDCTIYYVSKDYSEKFNIDFNGKITLEVKVNFNLVFCGDFDDLPNNIGSPIDFIMKNKERIVAVYRYVKSTEERDFFIGFSQSETIYNYGYLYLSLAKLLEEFEKNNVKYEIDTTEDKFTPALYRDEAATRFAISYSPKKEIESEKGHQLKKIKR